MTGAMYLAMWNKIFEIIPQLKINVTLISIDCERAAVKGIHDAFGGEVKILICYFHHQQVIHI